MNGGWRRVGEALPFAGGNDLVPADKAELVRLFEHLEGALDEAGFFRPPEKRPHMVQSLRAMLQRAGLSDQEVRTLRGVVAALEHSARRGRSRRSDGTVTTEARQGFLLKPVLVFDSGVGGLTVVAAIRAQMPELAIRFVADDSWFPYGPRADEAIVFARRGA